MNLEEHRKRIARIHKYAVELKDASRRPSNGFHDEIQLKTAMAIAAIADAMGEMDERLTRIEQRTL